LSETACEFVGIMTNTREKMAMKIAVVLIAASYWNKLSPKASPGLAAVS
jgi:hypothetical protein